MTVEQFKTLLIHLRVLIVIAGFIAGILVAFAWQYL